MVGAVTLEKGAATIPAKKVRVVISDAASQFSDLKAVKVTFNTNRPAGAGYKLIVKNAGGKDDEPGFEIVP